MARRRNESPNLAQTNPRPQVFIDRNCKPDIANPAKPIHVFSLWDCGISGGDILSSNANNDLGLALRPARIDQPTSERIKTMWKRECLYCGKEFETTSISGRFCLNNNKCKQAYYRQRKATGKAPAITKAPSKPQADNTTRNP